MAKLSRGSVPNTPTNLKTGAHLPKTPSVARGATTGQSNPTGRTGRGKAPKNLGQTRNGT